MLLIWFGRVYFPTGTRLSDPYHRNFLAYLGLCGGTWDSSHRRKTSTRMRDRTWPVGEPVEGELSQMDRIRQEECGWPVTVIDHVDEQRGSERDEATKRQFRCHVDAVDK